MTTFVEPADVNLVVELAKAQQCTCRPEHAIPDDVDGLGFDQCFPCQVVGLLRPSVEAFERPF